MAKPKEFDVEKYADNPKVIAQYLNEALATDDLAFITRAIGVIIRAQNVVALSKEAGLNRVNLYRSFKGTVDPRLGAILKVLAGVGVQLVVKPRASITAKRPRRAARSAAPSSGR
jgi:probable addiction module antidote protein